MALNQATNHTAKRYAACHENAFKLFNMNEPFVHFETVFNWEIEVYPSAKHHRNPDILREWYNAAPELWFWEEDDNNGDLIGLLAIVPFSIESILRLASTQFGEMEQKPFTKWREKKYLEKTVFHVYEFYSKNQNQQIAHKLFYRAKAKFNEIIRKYKALPMGFSALCVTKAGRKCAIKAGFDMVTITCENVKTEIQPEVRFTDLKPNSRILELLGLATKSNKSIIDCKIDSPDDFADKKKIFISYSAKDEQEAKRIYNEIKKKAKGDFEIYFAKKSNLPGSQWKSLLRDALSECDELAVIVTDNMVDSKWVMMEIGAAWAKNLKITPIIINKDLDIEKIPDALKDYQFVYYFSDTYEEYINSLRK